MKIMFSFRKKESFSTVFQICKFQEFYDCTLNFITANLVKFHWFRRLEREKLNRETNKQSKPSEVPAWWSRKVFVKNVYSRSTIKLKLVLHVIFLARTLLSEGLQLLIWTQWSLWSFRKKNSTNKMTVENFNTKS